MEEHDRRIQRWARSNGNQSQDKEKKAAIKRGAGTKSPNV